MKDRLPQELIDILTQRVGAKGLTWENLNDDMKLYRALQSWARLGLISEEDLPPQPDPSDYQ